MLHPNLNHPPPLNSLQTQYWQARSRSLRAKLDSNASEWNLSVRVFNELRATARFASREGQADRIFLIEFDAITTEAVLEEALLLMSPKESRLRLVLEYGLAIYWLAPGAILGWFGFRGVFDYSWGPDRDLPRFLFSAGMAAVPSLVILSVVRNARFIRKVKKGLLGARTLSFTELGISGGTPEGSTFDDTWTS